MNILFPFVGDSIGGSHRSTILLIEELRRRGMDVTIVVQTTGPLSRELNDRCIPHQVIGVELPNYPLLGRFSLILMILVLVGKYLKILRQYKITLVHANDARIQLAWALPCLVSRTPLIWHQRTIFQPSILTELMMRQARALICISSVVKNSVPMMSIPIQETIPNPVSSVAPSSEHSLNRRLEISKLGGVSGDCLIVGTIGNIRHIKRPIIFVKSLGILQDRLDTPCIGIFLGDDREGYEIQLKKINETGGIGERLLFMGFKSNIEEWIGACDVIVAPAVGEAFGRTILESMAVGVPVVAANADGHKELIRHGENGMLAESDNPSSFARMIYKVVKSQNLRQSIINVGKQDVISYSVQEHAERVVSIYNQVGL